MVPTETGVDGQDTVMLEYSDGTMASMFTTMYALTDRRGRVQWIFLTVGSAENIMNFGKKAEFMKNA